MTATVVYPDKSWKEISGRNIDSVLKKLRKIGIVISDFDSVIIQMSSGYTNLDSGGKISIKYGK